MKMIAAMLAMVSALAGNAALAQNLTPARDLFGAMATPAPMSSRAVGTYAGGCLAGAVALPADGPNWQVMRLSRDRYWGHPDMIAYLERFATDAARDGWPGLLVGDIGQPRGGPMLGGHVSHQTGLDVDIWYLPMPERRLTDRERAELGATSLIRAGTLEVDRTEWNESIARLLRRAASYPEVARIFVHPGIKRELCAWAGADRDWLNVIRPWYGHDDHFHVRLDCPAGDADCVPQAPPPEGDGCGAELAWWLGPEPWQPADPPVPPTPPKTMADLPGACTSVLETGGAPISPPPLPRPRPG